MRVHTIAFLALIGSAMLTAAGFAYVVELLIVGVPLMLLSAGVTVGSWPSSLDDRMEENRTAALLEPKRQAPRQPRRYPHPIAINPQPSADNARRGR